MTQNAQKYTAITTGTDVNTLNKRLLHVLHLMHSRGVNMRCVTITINRRLRLTMQPHIRRYLGELRRQLAQHKMHDDVSIYKGLLFTEVSLASHFPSLQPIADTLGQSLV